MKKMIKGFTAVALVASLMMLMSVSAFAATTYIVKDGAFQNAGSINAGELVDGTIQGPGNWTQLNLGDTAVDAPYLHVIISCTGDTAAASATISDTATYSFADLGITLTEEFQDVVLPVQESGLTSLSWANFTGLDGGSTVYTIKDVFLSDDAASSLAPAEVVAAPAEEVVVDEAAPAEEAPKTGSSNTVAVIALIALAGSAFAAVEIKKSRKAL